MSSDLRCDKWEDCICDSSCHPREEPPHLCRHHGGKFSEAKCPTCGDMLPCAKGACTIARLPVIDDAAVSKALQDLERDDDFTEPPSNTQPLEALVAEWNARATQFDEDIEPRISGQVGLCADELEAALADMREGQGERCACGHGFTEYHRTPGTECVYHYDEDPPYYCDCGAFKPATAAKGGD